jgi:hypothetical protein
MLAFALVGERNERGEESVLIWDDGTILHKVKHFCEIILCFT